MAKISRSTRNPLHQRAVASVALAFVLAVATLCVLAGCSGAADVATERVIQDVNASGTFNSKTANYNYVDDSRFAVDTLSIHSQSAVAGDTSARNVAFAGVAKNDNFAVEFSGTAKYKHTDGEYKPSSGPTITMDSIYPIKGVDWIKKSGVDGATDAGFSSTLEEHAGNFISRATQKVAYEQWFATDTADITAEFAFDAEKGWQMQGDSKVQNEYTTWTLAGKTLEAYSENGSYTGTFITFKDKTANGESEEDEARSTGPLEGSSSASSSDATDGSNTSSSDSADSSSSARATSSSDSTASASAVSSNAADITADYELHFAPQAPYISSSSVTYANVDIAGEFVCEFRHEFGKDSFSLVLTDAANSVTYKLATTSDTTIAGVGVKKTMKGGLETQSDWVITNSYLSNSKLESSNIAFTLKE